ncbi:unnamed protein product, partial [Mesorhabditis belari]|uniref:Uncharacterized protein n=1 Tax=Mesorhabditis belari TaxID=2138241 RepID=A0AAF3F6W5_9BILA
MSASIIYKVIRCEDRKEIPILTEDKSNSSLEISEEIKIKVSNWMEVRCLRLKLFKIFAAVISGKTKGYTRTIWQLQNDLTTKDEGFNHHEATASSVTSDEDFSTENAWDLFVQAMTKLTNEQMLVPNK